MGRPGPLPFHLLPFQAAGPVFTEAVGEGGACREPWTKQPVASPCSGPKWTLKYPGRPRPFLPLGLRGHIPSPGLSFLP